MPQAKLFQPQLSNFRRETKVMNRRIVFLLALTIPCAFLINGSSAIAAPQAAKKATQQERPAKKPNSTTLKESAKFSSLEQAPESRLSLWYKQPAKQWTDAMPIGNGRLGAMVYGGIQKEIIQLNEESIWAGPPFPVVKKYIAKETDEIRQMLFDGKYSAAQRKQAALMPTRIAPRSYQTMGTLEFDFATTGEATDYRRDLNLDTAITSTQFVINGVSYRREMFCSAVDDVAVLRMTADQKGAISFTADAKRGGKFEKTAGDSTIVCVGQAEHGGKHLGVKFASIYHIDAENGSVSRQDGRVTVEGADSVTVYVAINSDYNRDDTSSPLTDDLLDRGRAQITKAITKKYEAVKADAVKEYQALFHRVRLSLGEPSEQDTLTRLKAYQSENAKSDPDLESLFFHFGRYLLISSSREGCLPANLQGIWCKDERAPWNSDYHININFQMNYWPAEVTNLSECHLPMLDFVERLVPHGQQVARHLYGCNGFLAGHNSDVWHYATVFGKPQYGQWVIGGAWCTQHFMEHYRFTQDKTFLKDRGYPILKEASSFFLCWLVVHPETGKFVSGPSTSPENKFIDPSNGQKTNISMGPAMDQQVIWDTFTNTIEAAEVLGIEDEFVARVKELLSRLAPPQVGSDGRLMEWSEEFEEPDRGHRHISHLFGLYPGRQFNAEKTPELMVAARKSIDTRLANGGGHTGWSRAWIINFWARFQEAEKAHQNISMLLKKSTHNNLFDKHPPFQIDGNFGGTAGIAEMLLQSHTGSIELLPALPKAWNNGEVSGLCARGGFEVSMTWQDGKLTAANLISKSGLRCTVRYQGKTLTLETEQGQSYDLAKLWK